MYVSKLENSRELNLTLTSVTLDDSGWYKCVLTIQRHSPDGATDIKAANLTISVVAGICNCTLFSLANLLSANLTIISILDNYIIDILTCGLC